MTMQGPAMSTAVNGYNAGSPGYYVLRDGEVIDGPLMDFDTAREVAEDGDVVSYVIPKRLLSGEPACVTPESLPPGLLKRLAAGIPKYKTPADQPFVTTRQELWDKVITRSKPQWIDNPEGGRTYVLPTGALYADFYEFTGSKAEPASDRKDRCSSCGISKWQILGKHEEIRLELEAMTAARDLCKQQTQDVSDRYQARGRELEETLTWFRENHPEAHAAFLASGAWG